MYRSCLSNEKGRGLCEVGLGVIGGLYARVVARFDAELLLLWYNREITVSNGPMIHLDAC